MSIAIDGNCDAIIGCVSSCVIYPLSRNDDRKLAIPLRTRPNSRNAASFDDLVSIFFFYQRQLAAPVLSRERFREIRACEIESRGKRRKTVDRLAFIARLPDSDVRCPIERSPLTGPFASNRSIDRTIERASERQLSGNKNPVGISLRAHRFCRRLSARRAIARKRRGTVRLVGQKKSHGRNAVGGGGRRGGLLRSETDQSDIPPLSLKLSAYTRYNRLAVTGSERPLQEPATHRSRVVSRATL